MLSFNGRVTVAVAVALLKYKYNAAIPHCKIFTKFVSRSNQFCLGLVEIFAESTS